MPALEDIDGPNARELTVAAIGRSTSRVGFGTGGLLRLGRARERLNVLAAAEASGITHFDTAPIYGLGEAERALGGFLRGHRSRLTVTTKFGLRPSVLATRLAPWQRVGRRALHMFPSLRRAAARSSGALYSAPDYGPAAVRVSLESSLRALRTDYVDFFLAHQASPEALPGEELIGLLGDLRRSGKVLAFGVATDWNWLGPVVLRRPELGAVLQFDSTLSCQPPVVSGQSSEPLIISYGLLGRGIARARERAHDWDDLDDEALGGMLLRAAVLVNPRGIVLMQSRSLARIERNVRAALSRDNDARVRQLITLLRVATG
jgi:D-threo-aldose 1-dehydrogenase